MNDIAKTILAAKRRRFLVGRPVFVRHTLVSEAELFHIAIKLNFKFVLELSQWLRMAGYGDIDQNLSFREEWFSLIEAGPLQGHVSFAQDSDGNRYAFNPQDGSIYCISHPKQTVVRLSDDFASFLLELIRRDYKLAEWIGSFKL